MYRKNYPANVETVGQNTVFMQLINSVIDFKSLCCIGIGGEQESRTNEFAKILASKFQEYGKETLILSIKDYFHYPPKSNYNRRKRDINNIGPKEVDFSQLIGNIEFLKGKEADILFKPKVNIETDSIRKEFLEVENVQIVIIEGLYALLLEQLDINVFIDSDGKNILENDDQVDKRAQMIQHEIIRKHKRLANYVIDDKRGIKATEPKSTLSKRMWS